MFTVQLDSPNSFASKTTMRRIGIHLSFWQVKWNDDLHPLIARAQRAGFEVAEFPLLFPNDLDYRRLKAELDDRGMLASCGTGLGLQTDITHPDRQVRAAGMDHLRACIEGARRLGSPVLGGATYAPWAVFPQDDLLQRRKQCIASLREVVKVAEDNGIRLCMEVLNRFEGYLINTVQQGLAIIEEVGSHYLKLHLDTFHLNIEEDHLGEAIRRAGENLGHLHCVENNRKVPGQGHIPWQEVREAVNAIGYQGYVITEAFVNPAGEVGRGLFIWRPLAEDLDAAARQAAEFLKHEFADD
jgi:D-psicose/D-tagatose/L-ribulose 3-epimerase